MRAPLSTVLGLSVLLAACQGAPGRPSSTSPECSELLDALRDSAAARVGSRGFWPERGPALPPERYGVPNAEDFSGPLQGAVDPGTNGREPAVTEPGLMKTDGSRLLFVADGKLQIVDLATRETVHRLPLPEDFWLPTDLLVHGDRALLLLNRQFSRPQGEALFPRPGVEARILYVDLAEPRILGSLRADGARVLDARQTGSVARLVLHTAPKIDFPRIGGTDLESAGKRNRSLVREAPMEAFQPSYELTVGGKTTTRRVPCERITVPAGSDDVEMLSILTVDLAEGLEDDDPVAVAASGAIVYGTERSLYLTSSPWRKDVTQIHRFDLAEGRPRYTASGTVPGVAFHRYSMSEHEGDLRVAVTDRDRKAGSVHVLRAEGAELKEIGSLSGLDRKGDMSFVRFVGPRGYAVSSRDEVPLQVLDLSDPREPKPLGELAVDGRLSYLHPLDGDRLLGVGRKEGARGRSLGLRVFLFDVKRAPRKLSQLHLPKVREGQAEFGPGAFHHPPGSGLVVMNTARGRALVLTVEDDAVTQKGLVEHPRRGYIDRVLIVGDELWTFSRRHGLKASGTDTLAERAWIGW